MNKIIDTQAGFSVIESVLVLVIAGILGFTGWYVYHSQQNADKSYAPVNSGNPAFKSRLKSTNTVAQTTTKTSTSPTPAPLTALSIKMSTPTLIKDATPPGGGTQYGCDLGPVTVTFNKASGSVNYDLIETDTKTGKSTTLISSETDQWGDGLAANPGGTTWTYQLSMTGNSSGGGYDISTSNPDPRHWQVNVLSPNKISAQTADTDVCYKAGT